MPEGRRKEENEKKKKGPLQEPREGDGKRKRHSGKAQAAETGTYLKWQRVTLDLEGVSHHPWHLFGGGGVSMTAALGCDLEG